MLELQPLIPLKHLHLFYSTRYNIYKLDNFIFNIYKLDCQISRLNFLLFSRKELRKKIPKYLLKFSKSFSIIEEGVKNRIRQSKFTATQSEEEEEEEKEKRREKK